MRKLGMLILVVGIFSMYSCQYDSPEYLVNVVRVSPEKVGLSLVYQGKLYEVVTQSGDTVTCVVDEEIRLVRKIPYYAIMKKVPNEKFGRVFKISDPEPKSIMK